MKLGMMLSYEEEVHAKYLILRNYKDCLFYRSLKFGIFEKGVSLKMWISLVLLKQIWKIRRRSKAHELGYIMDVISKVKVQGHQHLVKFLFFEISIRGKLYKHDFFLVLVDPNQTWSACFWTEFWKVMVIYDTQGMKNNQI